MSYQLGVDLGTTYSSAALIRDFRAEMVVMGHRSPLVPSAIWLGPDGECLVGEAALRRGPRDLGRLVREFKRRLGDSVPFVVGGSPVTAARLTTLLLEWILDQVTAREGTRPTGVAITHPANWGPYRRELFSDAVAAAGVTDPILVPEPEAAALYYASTGRVADGEIVVVYDLGGGTFDVAILRRDGERFELLGRPDGVERLGGIDFDAVVFDHVREWLGGLDVTGGDDTWKSALRRLRDDCVDAKEALSADVVVDISVMLPARHSEIRLLRAEFEAMIRPSLVLTIAAVQRAIASAHLEPDDIGRVLLVGGSSRIPLVAELVGSELQRQVSVDVHPKFAVVLGAAMAAASGGTIDERLTVGMSAIAPVSDPVERLAVLEPVDDARLPPWPEPRSAPEALGPAGPLGSPEPASPPTSTQRHRRRGVIVAASVGVAALVGVAAVAIERDRSSGDASSATVAPMTTAPAAATVSATVPATIPAATIAVSEPIVVELAATPVGLAVGFGSAWAATSRGELVEMDVNTGAVLRRSQVAASFDDLAVGTSDLWATDGTTVYRVDPVTGATARTIVMPGQPDGIATSPGAIWIGVVGTGDGALHRIDETTDAATLVATLPSGITEVAVAGRFLWLTGLDRFVYRVDPATGEHVAIDVGGVTQGIVIGFGSLWVSVPATNEVLRLDGVSGRTLARIASFRAAPNELALGDGVIWVSEDDSAGVIAIDPGSDEISRRLAAGTGPDRVAWNDPTLWVANTGDNSVSVFQL